MTTRRRTHRPRPLTTLALLAALTLAAACTSDDEQPTSTPSPSPTAEATQAPTASPTPTPPPEAFVPTIAPDGRTPDPELNAIIENLLTDDAATLAQRSVGVAARELRSGMSGDRPVSRADWTARLAAAQRSLYAVTTTHSQTYTHDVDVTLAVNVDGQREGWRFAVDGDRVVGLVILDYPSIPSVTAVYERFLVLPPVEDLPQPPLAHSFRGDPPRTGDAAVDALIELVALGDDSALLDAVAFEDSTLPVVQCSGHHESRDAAYVESWFGRLAEQAVALHAVTELPDGYLPAAEHLLIVVRQTAPYDWELAGLLETDGRIVGLLSGCAPYPPSGFPTPPPPGGVAELDPTRRSGVASLDAVLDAFATGDRAALFALLDFTEVGCITEPSGIGSPPFCEDDQPQGTLLKLLPTAGCEGGYTPPDQLDMLLDYLLTIDWLLYAVVDRGDPALGFGGSYRGDLWAVLVTATPHPDFDAIRLSITDRGIASIWTGCGAATPGVILAQTGGAPSFLLAPPAPRSALWLIDIESGNRRILHQGDAQAMARFDPDGQSVSALVFPEDRRYLARRYDLDGRLIEQYEDRLLILTSPDGRSRVYPLVRPPSPEATRLVLEHDGVPVPIADAVKDTYAVAFSPDGARLLLGEFGRLEGASTVVFTYHVVSVETGESLFTFESRLHEGTDGGESPHWSPSGRYIASSGHIEGLVVHDTETGESPHLGHGLARWSPAGDAILALDDGGNLDLVRFPGAARTRLATDPDIGSPLFGANGRYAYWTDRDYTTTTVLDIATAEIVAHWDARPADPFAGVYPITAVPGGFAALLRARHDDCRGIEIHHPAIEGGSTCLDDAYVPRWSPDGRLLVYAVEGELHLLDISTGDDRLLARGIDRLYQSEGALARWSPDGAYLLIQWPAGGLGWTED